MKYDAELVEFVVREVIRRLTAAGQTVSPATSPTASPLRDLALTDRLITARTLHGKLEGVTAVVIGRRSVVTPSARDELNKRKISLKRQDL